MDQFAAISLEHYWMEFEVSESDLEFIYNLLLDREVPLTTVGMVVPLIKFRLEEAEKEAKKKVDSALELYLPSEKYTIGQKVQFTAIGSQVGEVVAVREGDNPTIGEFDVITVKFEGDGKPREFASQLADHKLNRLPEISSGGANSPEEIFNRYGSEIEKRVDTELGAADDIVRIAGKWFPKALLAEFHEGHLNLAEAVLDVAGGGPTSSKELMDHVEMPKNLDPLLAEFSLDYALQEDERFDEVGPAGEVLWHLKRLEPPEVLYAPPRLEYDPQLYDRSVLTEPLLELEDQLDDEHSEHHAPREKLDEVTISILFPHWRVGALPLSSNLQSLFPTAYKAPRIRFILVDGHSGESFPGWVVREHKYVYGLDDWYRKYEVPAGGLVRIKKGDRPGEVVIEAIDRRRRNDWIRTISVGKDGRIGFTMLKHPVGTAYDDRMVVGLIDPTGLDESWLRNSQREMTLDRIVAHVFRELAKLNPQSAVHAQSLYSGVNVIRRSPPGPIFAELVTRAYFMHVGDLYWRYDESVWSDR